MEHLSKCLLDLDATNNPDDLWAAQRKLASSIRSGLAEFQNAMATTKTTLWPKMFGSLTTTVPIGGLAALVATPIVGGAAHIIIASVVATALQIVKVGIDIRAEEEKARVTAGPAITYLTSVLDEFSRMK